MIATGETLLLVEPVREIRETKTRILEREGYRVVGLSSANAALQLITRPGVALVLLDLPEDRTTWEGLDAIRSRQAEPHADRFVARAERVHQIEQGCGVSLTLKNLAKAATALGKRVRVEFVDASAARSRHAVL